MFDLIIASVSSEEILNPSVPMALRLSGILMGGVVKVYLRKVELLYGDLSRLVLELNDARKTKPAVSDHTIFPKGKAQAKYESVTLPAQPEQVETELEQTVRFSNPSFVRLDHMRLEDIDEQYVNINVGDDDVSEQHHQADYVNITLFDNVSSGSLGGPHYDRFERFDIGEEEIQMNFTNIERNMLSPIIQSPKSPIIHDENTTAMHSSPHEHPPPAQGGGGSSGQQDEQGIKMDCEERQEEKKARKKRNRNNNSPNNTVIFDSDQTLVPNAVYQSWLRDPSDIFTKRRKINQVPNLNRVVKLTDMVELPPVGIITAFEIFPPKFYYPKQIMELWKECNRPGQSEADTSPPGGNSQQAQPQANDELPDFYPQDFPDINPEMYLSEEEIMRNNSSRSRSGGTGYISPTSSGHAAGSAPSSGSGPSLVPDQAEILPGRRSKKRNHSLSGGSNHLATVFEEPEPAFKLRSPSQPEFLVETGPTQTPIRGSNSEPSMDAKTESIRSHFKAYFEMPGNPQKASLNELTSGSKAKVAAQLFYQTCVLATANCIKVEQAEPYGDILISKAPKL
ncbi:hypothetical protein LUZ60_003865 [Juncus effusus]|nr:hypothetical protein LUZ60_003865 [Juncus effusus]